jgi:hypothetical protein
MDDSEPNSAAHPALMRLRSHGRLLIIIAALLLLYTLGGFLLVPHVARNAIIGYVQKNMGGRHASIGELKFNPFTFTIEVHQFALTEVNDSPIASFDLLRIGASLTASLVHRAWTLSEVRLEQPRVDALVERDGTLNLAKLAPATPPKPEKPETDHSLPALRIQALGVHGGSVRFEDRSRAEPFSTTLRPIEFDLTDFRTTRDFENKYRFSAQSAAGERLDWAGQFTLQPLGSTGEFTIAQLKALTIANYLQNALPFELVGGSLDIQGSYQFAATPATALSLNLPSIKIHSLGINPAASAGAGAASAAPWVSLPELDVNNTSVSLSERRVTIGEVLLQHAAVQVWRNADGSLNLQQLAGAAKAPASTPTPTPTPTPAPAPSSSAASAVPAWNIALAKLELQEANIAVEDRSVTPAFKTQLGAIALTVENYSSAGTAPLNIDLRMQIGQGGQLQTQGTVALSSMNSALDLTLSGLDLPALQPYVAQSTDLAIYRGKLGVKGHVVYTGVPARGQPKLQLALGINVADLATRDNFLNEDLVSWRSLQIDGMRYQMAPDALHIERIAVGAPYGRVVIGPKGGLNVAQILRPARAQGASGAQPAAESSEQGVTAVAAPPAGKGKARKSKSGSTPAAVAVAAPPRQPGMPMSIARIDIQDGVADFTDHSVEPTFSTAIYGLKGSVIGLSSDPASRATVSLDGSVDRYAPVSIKGKVNVLSAATFTDIAMSFSNIELPTFNPYSGKFAGYNITQGKLTTTMQYHVENRKLDAQHHIVIDQLEFGAATESKQAVPLPIKLAVSLLKDRNGVIDLDLPVGGSLDDPTFRVGPIIWKVFVNLIEKVVTAPFAALGKLFGGGPELSYVDFPAGASTLGAEQTQKLSQLASALVERPQLKLDVPLHTQADDDDAALERAALDNALQAADASGAAAARPRSPKSKSTAGAAGASSRASASASDSNGAASAQAAAQLPALVALYRTQFKSDPDYPPETDKVAWLQQQLLPQFAPSQAERDALSLARAQAVQSAVLTNTELKPDRVFLVNQVSGGGPDGKVRMELKLE